MIRRRVRKIRRRERETITHQNQEKFASAIHSPTINKEKLKEKWKRKRKKKKIPYPPTKKEKDFAARDTNSSSFKSIQKITIPKFHAKQF